MGGVYTIYAYFNSEQIQAILTSVVMLVGSSGVNGDYLSIIRVAAMMGLLMAVCYGFVRARGEDAGQYLLMVALFYSTLFVPRVTVSIEEHGGAGGGAPIVVDNVPLGLAFFASTTSHIGYWLTDSTETFFSLPDTSLRLSTHGLMGGVRALRLAQSSAIPDPVLAQDLINFMRDCINPELAMTPTYVTDLLSSTNIWNDLGPTGIGVLNPGRMVTLSGALGAQACDVAYSNTLNPLIAPAATSEFARIAKMLSPNASAATANTMLAALLPAAEGLIMTASASTTEAIRQRMMLNMFNDTSASMAQIMNDPSAAQTAMGAAMAASSANTTYAVMAKLAQETLPLIRNSIELVIIGVFPIVLILIIIAGSKGGVVLRSYVMTMLWVQLWAPLYAIVNYVGTMAGAKSLKAALAGVDGVSVVNAAQLLNTTISAEAIAGMLTISVPMIALAIVKGGEVAMSGIVSGITGPASSAASSAGGQVGLGNVSMGNQSWGNFQANNSTANGTNNAFAYTDTNRGEVKTPYGSFVFRGDAAGTPQGIGNLQAETGNMGVTGNHGKGVEAGHGNESGRRAEYAKGVSSDLQQRTSGQFTHQEGAAAAAKIGKALENAFGSDGSWNRRDSAGQAETAGERTGTSARVTHGSQIDMGGRAQVKGGADSIATNPVQEAKGRHNTKQTDELLHGQPQNGAAPAAAAGAAAPAGSVADLEQKAKSLANVLGDGPSRSSYGLGGSYGGGVQDSEGKDWSSERGNSAERQQRAERNFETAKRAVESVMAKTSNSGERAAMESFLGSLSKSTDATYGTNTRSTLSSSAGESDSRSNRVGASYQVNDNARYGEEALRLTGGNAYQALREAATNSHFLDQVGAAVGHDVAGSYVPSRGSLEGIDGQPIAQPKSVDSQHKDGDRQVASQSGRDQSAAEAAGNSRLAEGESHRAPMGAPTSTDMPSDAPAKTAFNEAKKDVGDRQKWAGERAAVSGGVNRVTDAIFEDKAGIGRLLDASLGFGLFGQAKTHDEIREPLKQLATYDEPSRDRFAAIGNIGRVTEQDMEFFAERAKVRGFE
jgi:conjugal transfer mating pair stabilization protein TraG